MCHALVMATAGLRERKKQETRDSLQSAALRLTAERGLDRVTVEAIAEAADVSPRTFFNYFSSKEEALVGAQDQWTQQIHAALDDRPADEEPLELLRAVLIDLASTVAQSRDRHLLLMKVMADNPGLLPRQVAAFVAFETLLVEAITARAPDGAATDVGLTVACGVSALRVSVNRWLATEGVDLFSLLDTAINTLAVGLAPASDRSTSHSKTPTKLRTR